MPLTYTRVFFHAYSSVVDGPDPDRDPDLVPIPDIKVTFKPAVSRVVVPEESKTIFLNDLVAYTNAEGYLVSEDGTLGVSILASDGPISPSGWTWTATISGKSINPVSISLVALGGMDIDLSTLIPVPSNPGQELIQWQEAVTTTLTARDETLVARDEMLDARNDALSAANTATSAAATATNAATTATNAATTAAIGGFLSGTGSPQGVLAAPVGSQYRDTAATTGAVIWVKASGTGTSGWRVSDGDTGWRDVTSLRDANWTDAPSGNVFRIKRDRATVMLEGRMALATDSTMIGKPRTSSVLIVFLPAGFMPGSLIVYGQATLGTSTSFGGLTTAAGSSEARIVLPSATGNWTAGDMVTLSAVWTTTQAWPTTLPGSPTA